MFESGKRPRSTSSDCVFCLPGADHEIDTEAYEGITIFTDGHKDEIWWQDNCCADGQRGAVMYE